MGTILVVDDDEVLQCLIGTTFEAAGHRAIRIVDPREIHGHVVEHSPDAILLDVNMPGMSGWDVLQWLRDIPAFRDIPVLMLSADNTVQSRVRGLRSGADDYLTKPFATEELLARLEALLARQEKDRRGLRGNLQENPLVEVVQGLAQNGKSGRLEVVHTHHVGWVSFDQGQISAAKFDGLTGRSAILALLELGEGQFSFDPEAEGPPATKDGMLGIQALLMDAAWIADELRALEGFVPKAMSVLDAGPEPGDPGEGFSALPIRSLWARIHGGAETRAAELIAGRHGSPNEVRLALAWLIQQGHVVVRTVDTGEDPSEASQNFTWDLGTGEIDTRAFARSQAGAQAPPAEPRAEDEHSLETMDTALRELFQAAMARGFSLDRLSLAWVVDDTAWPTAATVIHQLPATLTVDDFAARGAIIDARQGRLVLRHESADVHANFSKLDTALAAEPFEASTAGVVLLWGSILSRVALTMAVSTLQNNAPPGAGCVLVARDGETARMAQDLLAKNPRWTVSRDLRMTFSSVLFDLCNLEI